MVILYHLNGGMIDFATQYQSLLSYKIEINRENAIFSFMSILAATKDTPYQIDLLIDEYDNFANEVLIAGEFDNQEHYQRLIGGHWFSKKGNHKGCPYAWYCRGNPCGCPDERD